MSERQGQHEFKKQVVNLHRAKRKALYCTACPLMNKVGIDKKGENIKLEAHHVEPYYVNKTHNPEQALLLCSYAHHLSHRANGLLSAIGERLRKEVVVNSDLEFYNVGIKNCPNKE